MAKKFEELLYIDSEGLKEVIDFCSNENNLGSDGARIFYIERAQTTRPSNKKLPAAEAALMYGVRLLAYEKPTEAQEGYFRNFHSTLLDNVIGRREAESY